MKKIKKNGAQGVQVPVSAILDRIRMITNNYLSSIFMKAFALSGRDDFPEMLDQIGIPEEEREAFIAQLIPILDEDGEPVEPSSVAEHMTRALATAVATWFSDETMNSLISAHFRLDKNTEAGGVRYESMIGNASVEIIDGEGLRFSEAAKLDEGFEEFKKRIAEDYTGYTILIRLPVFARESPIRPTENLIRPTSKLVKP